MTIAPPSMRERPLPSCALLTGAFLASDFLTAALFATGGAVFFTAFETLGLGFECSSWWAFWMGCLASFAGRVFPPFPKSRPGQAL